MAVEQAQQLGPRVAGGSHDCDADLAGLLHGLLEP
jgi:hypothetical protein